MKMISWSLLTEHGQSSLQKQNGYEDDFFSRTHGNGRGQKWQPNAFNINQEEYAKRPFEKGII